MRAAMQASVGRSARLPRLGSLICCLLAAALAGSPASTEELPKEKGPARTVKMFDVFCLSQLPDIEGVAKVAGFGEFAPIKGKELDTYQPEVPAEDLRAWKFDDLGTELVLTAAKSRPDAEFQKAVPKFAKSKSVACSMLFPAVDAKDAVLKELVAILGRGPDETWEDGPMQVHAWSGETDKLLSHVYYYAPTQKGPKGVLSATSFVLD
jgi:hypothetical protein